MLKTDNMLKKLDTIVYHPNNYTGSELFWENLTQYSIPTLIGTQHYHNTHQIAASNALSETFTVGCLCQACIAEH